MVGVDPGVDNRDLRAARPLGPGGRRVDVISARAVSDRPLQRVQRVVRRLGGVGELVVVGLGVGDIGMVREPLAQQRQGDPRARLDERQAAAFDAGKALRQPALQCGEDLLLAVLRRALLKADQQLAGGRRTGRRVSRAGWLAPAVLGNELDRSRASHRTEVAVIEGQHAAAVALGAGDHAGVGETQPQILEGLEEVYDSA